jgi:CRP/FNR family cyclic AMP-dependent transcriptional regulator
LSQHLQSCQRRIYSANETIIAPGDDSDSLYCILKGSVAVVMDDDDGHEIVLAYLNEGEFFGEMGMFDERAQRSAWVRARTEAEVARIDYQGLRDLVRSSPEAILAMLGQMSLRLRNTSRKVGDLAFKDVSGRIAGALLDLCDQPDAVRTTDGFEIEITRQELGRIVGCSREVASRVLKGLQHRDLLMVLGKKISVRRRRLSAYARRSD